MGAYLSQPNTTKTSSDGGNTNMSYGFSTMQGWRVSMEVRWKMNERVENNLTAALASVVSGGWMAEYDDGFFPEYCESSSHSQNGLSLSINSGDGWNPYVNFGELLTCWVAKFISHNILKYLLRSTVWILIAHTWILHPVPLSHFVKPCSSKQSNKG